MRVNEIFYSLQGEGRWTGTPSVFVRFSGCNLNCSFCDTDHADGNEMTARQIVDRVRDAVSSLSLFAQVMNGIHVVLTGGEPSLQVTDELICLLHKEGWFVQIETNGTRQLPAGIDWVTCSPKEGTALQLDNVDELKVVYDGKMDLAQYEGFSAQVFSLQPMDTGDPDANRLITEQTVLYCKEHPQWHLSLQTHKLIGIR